MSLALGNTPNLTNPTMGKGVTNTSSPSPSAPSQHHGNQHQSKKLKFKTVKKVMRGK